MTSQGHAHARFRRALLTKNLKLIDQFETASFHPTGLLGTAYWYGLFPIHSWIFKGMLTKISVAARAPEESRRPLRGVTTGLDHL